MPSPPAADLEAHRSRLRVHCYRMTGCLQDAEDLVQETLVRAWEKGPSFRGEASLTTWLYRIATNACLDFLRSRKSRRLPWGPEFPQYRHGDELPHPEAEAVWLEPFPTPEDQALRREHIALAYLTLLQTLPPNQRAAVVLVEGLGYSAQEAADLLETTVASVNSALQRARKGRGEGRPEPDPRGSRDILERFVRAWETGNAAAIVAMMKSDTRMVMPPYPLWVQGPGDILRVLQDYPFHGDPARWRLVPGVRANGSPALGFYGRDTTGVFVPWGVQVLDLAADPNDGSPFIAGYYVFKGPHLVTAFGLPPSVEG